MPTTQTVTIALQFAIATLLPVLACIVLTKLADHPFLANLGYRKQQVLYGVVFGAIAIYGTEFGIDTGDATMNVRDAAPIAAGLFFGGPAGILAGLIGGIERWFSALWGRGMFTRLACSLGTVAAGFYAAALRHYVFERRKPSWLVGLTIGVTVEVLHLLLIFITNFTEALRAFYVVQVCSWPMIGCVGVSVALCSIAVRALGGQKPLGDNVRDISQVIQKDMYVVVIIGFFATVGFTFVLQNSVMIADVDDTLTLQINDVKEDILDATRRSGLTSQSALVTRVRSTVANRHVGHDGMLMVFTSDGTYVGTRSNMFVLQADARKVFDGTDIYHPGDLFVVKLQDTFYYAMYQNVEDLRTVALLPVLEAKEHRDLAVMITSFMEVVVFAALFVAIYLLIKNVVVSSIWQVNETLDKITSGDLDAQVNVRGSSEFASLSDDINRTVGALREAIAAEGARIEKDLSTAKAIQESALPRSFPPFPDIDAFDIFASMKAAREVGGDFYDFFMVDDHTLCFLIADVSGKGIPASLFMMAAKSELANYIQSGMELKEAVASANRTLCRHNEAGMFVTVWAATLDHNTGRLTYVNAGHNPPLLRHDGAWQWLKRRNGLFLGTFDTATYTSATIDLVPGDELLLYTDGVNEAFSANEEEYGNDRLEAFLSQHTNQHPRVLVEMLKADVRRWSRGAEQSDDITLLCLEYGVPPEVSGSFTVEASEQGLTDLRNRMHYKLSQLQCPAQTQRYVDHTLEELFTNIYQHSYASREEPGKVRVEFLYNSNPSSITIALTDWGIAFNPLEHTRQDFADQGDEVTGLGIELALTYVDDCSYVRGSDYNTVAFLKYW